MKFSKLNKLAWKYQADKLTFVLYRMDNYMLYRINGKGTPYYFTYNEELVRIFKEINLTPSPRKDKRLHFSYRDVSGKQHHIFAHVLAYGVYNGFISRNNFYEDVQQFVKIKDKLTVDHSDGNIFNNTKNNLSLMTKSQNLSKGNITKKINIPEGVVIAADGDKYRVAFIMKVNLYSNLDSICNQIKVNHNNCIYAKLQFICGSAESLVKCLNKITNAGFSWRTPYRKNRRWVEQGRKSLVDDTLKSIQMQETLLKEDEYQFNHF